MTEHRTLPRTLAGAAIAAALAGAGAATPALAAPAPPVQPICPADPANPFTDLDPASVHTPNVVCAGVIGILKGGPGGQPADVFGPLGTTTRGQLATLVVNLVETYDMELTGEPADRFQDDDGHVHERSINFLSQLDVIGPDVSGGFEFDPDDPATRGLIANFMHGTWLLVVGDDLPPGPDAFGDDEGHPFEDEIDALAAAGVISGKGPGVFDPDASVTREQIATMFVRFLDRAAEAIATA